jgi:hypothetical protein
VDRLDEFRFDGADLGWWESVANGSGGITEWEWVEKSTANGERAMRARMGQGEEQARRVRTGKE